MSGDRWAVGYLRVSTAEQVEGYGLASQRAAIEEWAAREGVTLGGIYDDPGVSGTVEVLARPGLCSALEALTEYPGTLVVMRMDRLARDVVVQETLIRTLAREGIDVFSVMEGNLSDDPDDPSRRLIRTMFGAMAEHERALINIRTRKGKLQKRKVGGWLGGPAPFGFRLVRGNLATDAHEWPVLVRLMAWHAQALKWTDIARMANERGLRTRTGVPWCRQTVTATVRRMAELCVAYPSLDAILRADVDVVNGGLVPVEPTDAFWRDDRWQFIDHLATVERDASA